MTVGYNGLTFTGAGEVSFVLSYTVKNGVVHTMYAQPVTMTVLGDEEESTTATEESTTLPEDTESSAVETDPSEETTEALIETADDQTSAEAADSTHAPTEESGCKSVMAMGLLTVTLAAATLTLVKKGKREEN